MRFGRLAVMAWAAAIALVLGACGSSSTAGGSPSPSAASTTTVSTMFGDVTIPVTSAPKVIALGWSDAEMALALGVKPIAVFDWQGFGEAKKGVGPWATPLFGDVKPTLISRATQTLNYEEIQKLNPDLILNLRSDNKKETYDKLAAIAPTVYAPTGTGAFATDWKVQLTSIGKALNKVDEAKKLADDVSAKIKVAAKPEFKGVTIASAAKFGDAYGAYLPGDGRFDLLSELGFVNNPPIVALTSNGFFATVPVEKVTVLDAQVAVILPLGYTVEQTKADPLLSSLSVVKKNKAIFIEPQSDLGGAWGAASVLSIPVVLEQLTPQLQKAVAA